MERFIQQILSKGLNVVSMMTIFHAENQTVTATTFVELAEIIPTVLVYED